MPSSRKPYHKLPQRAFRARPPGQQRCPAVTTMTPNENILKIAKELLNDLDAQLVQNTTDQEHVERDIKGYSDHATPAKGNYDNAVLAAKVACEEAEDWSRHLGMEPDGGSIPQQEMLKNLQNKAEKLNEKKRTDGEILERCELQLEQARDRLTTLKTKRKAIIVQRDRAAADVEKLLKS